MKKFLSLVLALVMTMSLVTVSAGAYTDDSKVNYDEAVEVISALGIVGGYTDGSFKPQGTLTRGAAAKIICIMTLGADGAAALPSNITSYPDVVAGSTYASYVAYCKSEGIVSGYADGTFKPGNTLTGFAFLKMLLGALGYDANVEGLNDPNSWQIKTAQLSKKVGLYEGNDNFNGNVAATREAACLYALNALKAQTVYYDQNSVINIGGIEIAQTSSAKLEWDIDNVDAHQLYEDGFDKLAYTNVADKLGRPATKYVITGVHGDEIGTYAKTAKVTYTTKFKAKDAYTALGLDDDDYYFYGYKNGDTDAAYTVNPVSKYDNTEIGGNGIITEFYLDKDAKWGNVSFIHPVIMEVTKVTEAKKDVDRHLKVEGKNITIADYETEDFAKDDMLLAYVGKDTRCNDTVVSAEKVEKLTGKITKVMANGDIYVDGVKYERSASDYVDIAAGLSAKDEVEFYLDANGYVLKMKKTVDTINLSNIAFVEKSGSGASTGDYADDAVYKATLRFADGTSKVVTTAKDYSATGADASDNYANSLVTFKTNSKGKVELKQDADSFYFYGYSAGKVTKVEKGNPVITMGNNTYSTNSKTVFVYADWDSSSNSYETKTYTGYKNAPSVVDASLAVYKKGSTVQLVYVYGATASADATKTYFVYDNDAHLVSDSDYETDYYETTMLSGGKTSSVKVDSATYDAIGAVGTLVAVSSVTTDKEGIVTGVTSAVAVDAASSAKIEIGSEVVKFNTVVKAYADDVKCWSINSDLDTVTAIELDDILKNEGTTDYYSAVYYTLDADDTYIVTNIFVVEYDG